MNPQETEQFYLCCLLEAAKHGDLETTLDADDFESADNGKIFSAMVRQYREGKIPDIVTLVQDKALDIDRKHTVIAELTNGAWTYANIKSYEEIIHSASRDRSFVKALRLAFEEKQAGAETDAVIHNLLPALESVLDARNEQSVKTAEALLTAEYPPIDWIVEGLIGEGLTMICGAPKIGKSWLVLSLALAAAQGGAFLGTLQAQKTGVLYLALEDTERRIKRRLELLEAEPHQVGGLRIATRWKDGYVGLRNYVKRHPDITLVIVDTLVQFARITDMNAYAETSQALAKIKQVADDLHIAVVVIHHAKKGGSKDGADWMESALGSVGLTGAADATVLISRDRSKDKTNTGAVLYATGRDTEDVRYTLKFDLDCEGWTIDTKAELIAKIKKRGVLTRADIQGTL